MGKWLDCIKIIRVMIVEDGWVDAVEVAMKLDWSHQKVSKLIHYRLVPRYIKREKIGKKYR